ncbi:MAG: beta-aspartyl-peptidase [Syntrophomonadaceae bacterium]|nr:beta-aspartyl-peptidase [Syntrophomonadaceae bacterium]
MFKILKGGHVYSPDDLGRKDVLVVNGTIGGIREEISAEHLWDTEVIDCRDCYVCPGLVDQHVHITGGGGEQGPISRIPEVMFSTVVEAGVTTVVGLLGFDSISRGIATLLSKARGLEAEGITTYIYTGSYGSPTETMTGRVLTDIALLDKVIGVGEIAIADYRSNHPTLEELRTLASEANAGGMLGGKAGVLHLHVGDGKEGLQSLFRLIDESDFPLEIFVPTHINRNPHLFEQGIEFLRRGGQIDLTAGETQGYPVPQALQMLIQKGLDIDKVTVSSDGNGSAPNPAGVAELSALYSDLKAAVLDYHLDLTTVIKTATLNPARILKLYPRKGCLQAGTDADILVCRRNDLSIYRLLARGEVVVSEGKAVKKGRYEK